MNTYMIRELKEANIVITKVINLNEDIFLNIIKKIGNKKIILTGMGSSYFCNEIGTYFLRNITLDEINYCCSSNEIKNTFPYLNKEYFIITFSQSGNTKEVSNILKQLKDDNISNFSLTNNLKGEHIKLSNNNFF